MTRFDQLEVLLVGGECGTEDGERLMLEQDGYRVRVACDFGRAGTSIRRRLPDLVVVDGRLDGIASSLVALVGIHPRTRGIPVLVYHPAEANLPPRLTFAYPPEDAEAIPWSPASAA